MQNSVIIKLQFLQVGHAVESLQLRNEVVAKGQHLDLVAEEAVLLDFAQPAADEVFFFFLALFGLEKEGLFAESVKGDLLALLADFLRVLDNLESGLLGNFLIHGNDLKYIQSCSYFIQSWNVPQLPQNFLNRHADRTLLPLHAPRLRFPPPKRLLDLCLPAGLR